MKTLKKIKKNFSKKTYQKNKLGSGIGFNLTEAFHDIFLDIPYL